MTPWLLVAGDLTPLGGMDRANHALARYLAARGTEVHLVTHRAWPDLAAMPTIRVHRVWRPFNRHMLGGPLLSRTGRRVWRRLQPRGARALVNGGNCKIGDVNWVHYLHAAFAAHSNGHAGHRTRRALAYRLDTAAEHAALREARIILCNSRRTKQDIVERIGIPAERVHVVYYGSDPVRFSPVSAADRMTAKRVLGFSADRPLVGFIGALGDRRKAFDTVFEAWSTLCRCPDWDADLVVVGSGAEQRSWQIRADAARLGHRMRFLGFRRDVPEIVAALDALVHPARYEAYGLAVHETLCRGVPAIVSESAGVAEMYSPGLADLLISDPDSARELVDRLKAWRSSVERFEELAAAVSATLRAHTWDQMAQQIVDRVEAAQ
jgi:glycosyltransferase involved in cell wall biosynthesis